MVPRATEARILRYPPKPQGLGTTVEHLGGNRQDFADGSATSCEARRLLLDHRQLKGSRSPLALQSLQRILALSFKLTISAPLSHGGASRGVTAPMAVSTRVLARLLKAVAIVGLTLFAGLGALAGVQALMEAKDRAEFRRTETYATLSDGRKVRFLERGRGSPNTLVLANGLLATLDQWEALLAALPCYRFSGLI